jgi:hypothetical protein
MISGGNRYPAWLICDITLTAERTVERVAESAFVQTPLDDRVKFQVFLTAAGYWQTVPNENFNSRRPRPPVGLAIDSGIVALKTLQKRGVMTVGERMPIRWAIKP